MLRPLSLGLILSLSSVTSLAPAQSKQQSEVLIGAAISLQPALEEIKAGLKAEKDLPEIRFNFASSGALQQQIEQGAPLDIFIAAGEEPMQRLESKALIDQASRAPLLGNTLVLAAPAGNSRNLKDLSELKAAAFKKIALGDPKTVPAGQYAKDALDHAKLKETLQPKLVYGSNVKQVLTYVESGDVDAGFVYASDIKNNPKVKSLFEVPSSMHRPIVYPAALVKASKQSEAARRLLKELRSEKSRAVFEKYGFLSVAQPAG